MSRYEEDDDERQQYDDGYNREEYRSNRYYNDVDESYDEEYDQGSTPSCDWETYRSTSILLPPEKLDANGIPIRPKAILHFVGGTFFGSYPRKFYGSLLEDIALKCDAVIVATPIPLVLPGKGLVNQLEKWMFNEEGGQKRRRTRDESDTNNPLDHSSLAETIQNDFNNAYRDVILDEYCSGYRNDKGAEEITEQALIFAMENKDWLLMAHIKNIKANIAVNNRDYKLAEKLYNEEMQHHQVLHCPVGEAQSWANLARLAKTQNQPEKFDFAINKAITIANTRELTSQLNYFIQTKENGFN